MNIEELAREVGMQAQKDADYRRSREQEMTSPEAAAHAQMMRFAGLVRRQALLEAAEVADAQKAHAAVCATAGLRGAKESAETAGLIATDIRAIIDHEIQPRDG